MAQVSLWAICNIIVQDNAVDSIDILRSLDVQFAQEGLSTQHARLTLLVKNIIATNLTSLTLSSLPRIDIPLLRLIVKSFPRLVNLHLSCTERLDFNCCWVCFEDSLGCTIHSPVPDSYANPEDLGEAFANALKPLTWLTHLHLGIFLSHEQLMYAHIDHSLQTERSLHHESAEPECQLCDAVAAGVRVQELAVSLVLAQKLKAVKSIGWSSFFVACATKGSEEDRGQNTNHGNGANEQSRASDPGGRAATISVPLQTTIWVLRIGGRIRVRRRPW
ncbi:hypothetical protein BD779DRAFT_1676064 [Infundibulicybe gibba]|nr:hypothetical protein BD779DRAFT_1676064 [Infundibulicybe gibba]